MKNGRDFGRLNIMSLGLKVSSKIGVVVKIDIIPPAFVKKPRN